MKLIAREAHFKLAMLAKAKDDVRFYLNGICFMPNGDLVGTNGHVLFVGRHPNKLEEPVIINVSGKIPTRFYQVEIDIDGKYGRAEYKSSTMGTIGFGVVQVIEGRFPSYQRIFENFTPAPVQRIAFNSEYLVMGDKIAKAFNPRFSCIAFDTQSDDKVARMEINDCVGSGEEASHSVFFYLSPMRF